MVTRGWVETVMGSKLFNAYRVTVWDNEKVLKMDSGGTSLAAQWLRICLPMQGTFDP